MATIKPLHIDPTTGLPTEMAAGDSIAGASQVTQFSAANGESGAITKSMLVYVSASATVKKAKADASATAMAIGFVADTSIAAAATGLIQTDGVLDGFTSLTPGATYFADAATAGAITATAPTASGSHVVKVGKALSATELLIDIDYVGARA